MTFRRRLLVTTLVLGGGLYAFQPILRHRMESRLSEILQSQVNIGSSKIALIDGAIYLEDVVVVPNRSTVVNRVPHLALRFDWPSIFYRNLQVNNLVASNVTWSFAQPGNEIVPHADEADLNTLLARPQNETDGHIDSILKPAKLMINDEGGKQSHGQGAISSRLQLLSSRLSDAVANNGSINVLRQEKFLIEDAKRELAQIRQSIAEDRIHRKASDRTVQALKQSAASELRTRLDSDLKSSIQDVHQSAISVATLAVAQEWNAMRPILFATLETITSLEDHNKPSSMIDRQDGQLENEASSFKSMVPDRYTVLKLGKLQGTAMFDTPFLSGTEKLFNFEMKVNQLSSQEVLQGNLPSVRLTMQVPSNKSPNPFLQCKVERISLPQSNGSQLRFQIEHMAGQQSVCTMRVQQAHNGWSSTLSISTESCLAIDPWTAIATSNSSDHTNLKSTSDLNVTAKLVATTLSPSAPKNCVAIQIDPQSIEQLETEMAASRRDLLNQHRAEMEICGTQKLHSEWLNLSLRWDQLGDEHVRAHAAWESTVKELVAQVQILESVFKRTTRSNAPSTTL